MFRNSTAPTPEITTPVISDGSDLIPLSHLELDLVAPPLGWLIELDRRGIPVVHDDLGRRAVSRDDAKMLLAEQSEAGSYYRCGRQGFGVGNIVGAAVGARVGL